MNIITKVKNWITTPYTIYHILKDPSVSRFVKQRSVIILIIIYIYILSPFDIFPDYIPLSGWLDDLIIVPLGAALLRKLVPDIDIIDRKNSAEKTVNKALRKTIIWAVVVLFLLLWFSIMIYLFVKMATS